MKRRLVQSPISRLLWRRSLSKYDHYQPEPILDSVYSSKDVKEDPDNPKKDVYSNHRFIDKLNIEVKGGRGGNGCISFEMPSPAVKRPTGGNGGAGGNVYIIADNALTHLQLQRAHFNAGSGAHGGGDGMTGKRGDDVYVSVPCGTIVSEKLSSSQLLGSIEQTDLFGNDPEAYDVDPPSVDLDEHGKCILVARGGKPGLGNKALSGGKGKLFRSVTSNKSNGSLGEHKCLTLELKSIADVGLVGYPNAGKSTLLAALSSARPKIAPYPFTTLHPNIGVIKYSDYQTVTMADIPGIIDGASNDRGLGHEFLRHIERTKILVYVVDGSGSDDRLPGEDLKSLVMELKNYDTSLIKRPSIIFLNKTDLQGTSTTEGFFSFGAEKEKMHEHLRRAANRLGLQLLKGSAKYSRGVGELADKIREMIEDHKAQQRIDHSQ